MKCRKNNGDDDGGAATKLGLYLAQTEKCILKDVALMLHLGLPLVNGTTWDSKV